MAGALAAEKFRDPARTAKGEPRAHVPFAGLRTLWVNTGTLCNIECAGCYIESSPTNDRLAYFTIDDFRPLLAAAVGLGAREVGLTGGEPFMNRDCLAIAEASLEAGLDALILTNAMAPMMRRKEQAILLALLRRHGERLKLRISLDHYTEERHDAERGAGAFASAIKGLSWLGAQGFSISAAGRMMWDETEEEARAGYAALFERLKLAIDAFDPGRLVLFPEMDASRDTPEISTACWGVLGKSPANVMCATSRMAVRRKGAERPAILACTLIPYDERFELGATLEEATGPVALNHPHCSRFCVLGGASCSPR
jgi:hypothetical protein